ncbi:MAG: OB-fold domain-containing protein [Dehalococcoidia bacterium]
MTTETPSKLIPEPDDASAPFWEGSLEGKLRLMRCTACGIARLPAREHCDACLSTEYEWFDASGGGSIRTFGVMHQKYHPGFYDELPYTVAIVELDEGPRLPTNIVGLAGKKAEVGMRVIVDWERHDDVALPKFRPA